MKRPLIDIGVACSGSHYPDWTSGVLAMLLAEAQTGNVEINQIRFVNTALVDVSKNIVAADPRDALGNDIPPASVEEKRRNSLTDSNRVSVARGFLQGEADYLFFMDDDTVPPRGVLSHLAALQKDFVAGLYFLPGPPFNPIAYYRTKDGTYAAVYHYTKGELKQVDSVGMGCTLIHRSVFERVIAGHTVYERHNGSLAVVPNNRIGCNDVAVMGQDAPDYFVANGYLLSRVRQRSVDDNRPWPFFAMEYGRTEDHHFCELAANVGVKPWLDTLIECQHLKMRSIDRETYKAAAELVERPVVS